MLELDFEDLALEIILLIKKEDKCFGIFPKKKSKKKK